MRDYSNITDAKLEFVDGLDNTSGIAEKAYFLPLSWIQTEAVPAAEGTTAASLVEIADGQVMKAGKAPVELDALVKKGNL